MSCTIMNCTLSSLPMNSMLAESCSSTYQSMCDLQCEEGFFGIGDPSYVCNMLSDGSVMWITSGGGWCCERSRLLYCIWCCVSRHTVVVRPKKPARNTVNILIGKRECGYLTSVALCCLYETRRFLLWTCPLTSVLHIPNLSEITSSVPEICDFKNWLSFFVFLLIFRTLTKTAIKHKRHI